MILEHNFLRKTIAVLIFAFIFGLFAQDTLAQGRSTITGFVFDKQRNSLVDVDVELLNEFYQVKNRAKTDGAGRYQFGGLSDGYYTVRVLPFRYDLEDQEQLVEIVTMTITGQGNGSEYKQLDFYLIPKKGGLAEAELGLVFAQDVPEDAKKAYKKAITELTDKKTESSGMNELNNAISAFPNYYDALYRMGKELYRRGRYKEAIPYLFKSTEINSKSAASFFYLGYSLHKLGGEYNKAAITSLSQASTLAPASVQIFFALGMVERSSGKLDDAEKHLLQAKKLADKPVAEIQRELSQLYGNDLKKYKEAADELELYLKASKLSNEDEKVIKSKIKDLREKAKTGS